MLQLGNRRYRRTTESQLAGKQVVADILNAGAFESMLTRPDFAYPGLRVKSKL
jgi:hypothetical protein